MASGAAYDPAAIFGSNAMAATPTSRRPATTAPTLGNSPKAKRSSARPEPPAQAASQADLTAGELSQGYRFLDGQNTTNIAALQNVGEALDDHAQRLDVLWSMTVRIDSRVQETTAKIVENDTSLKENLASLETIVTEQGNAIPQLRTDVQSAVKDIAKVLERIPDQSLGAQPTAPSDRVAIEAQFLALKSQIEGSVGAIEAAMRDLHVDVLRNRVEEMSNAMQAHAQQNNEMSNAMQAHAQQSNQRLAQLESRQASTPTAAPAEPQHGPWGPSRGAASSGAAPAPATDGAQHPVQGQGVSQPPTFAHMHPGLNVPRAQPGALQQPPQWQQWQQQQQQQPTRHFIGDKPVFDEKTATSEAMKYPDGSDMRARDQWMKTARNYLIGRAGEMEMFLLWAENWQSHPISKADVASLAQSNVCMDHDPSKLSKDLWSFLNLSMAGARDKSHLEHADPGNGFDVWRRIVVPLGPRSAERLGRMHDAVTIPTKVKRAVEVEKALDDWELDLSEYYRCGGAKLAEDTKIRTAAKILPAAPEIDATIHLQLKHLIDSGATYYQWREHLRVSTNYLIDIGCMRGSGGAAHVVNDGIPKIPESWGSQVGAEDVHQAEHESVPEMPAPDDFPEGTFANEDAKARYALVVSRFQQRRRPTPAPKKRPSPIQKGTDGNGPPRDVRDIKCANCGQAGHTAPECSRPKVELSQRKCHKCGKPGHIARFCKEKSPAKVAVVQAEAPSTRRVLMVHSSDDLGVPQPPTLGDCHVRVRARNQRGRRGGARLCMPGCGCWEDTGLGALSSQIPESAPTPAAPRAEASKGTPSSGVAAEAFPPLSESTPISKSAAKRAAKAERAARFDEDIEDHLRAMNLGVSAHPEASEVPQPRLQASRPCSPSHEHLERVEGECPEPVGPSSSAGGEQPMSPPVELRAHAILPVTTNDEHLFQVGEFVERDIEIILDSGCSAHVMDSEHAPGYNVSPSPGSMRGQTFYVGNGEPLPNEGQINLHFAARDDTGEMQNLSSIFQVAEVTSPLMSVSSICDKGFTCVFDSKCGRVLDQQGATVCTFDRSNGLYVKSVKLQPPEPFHRPA